MKVVGKKLGVDCRDNAKENERNTRLEVTKMMQVDEQATEMKSECSVRFPVDSMRLATLTVSPKRQYLGIVTPTTPPTTDPLCRPQRIVNLRSGRCAIYNTVYTRYAPFWRVMEIN